MNGKISCYLVFQKKLRNYTVNLWRSLLCLEEYTSRVYMRDGNQKGNERGKKKVMKE
jgi:hypothetical protein